MHYHKRGFTIIEVSLVLAIAGLILVMAFIALPALQRQSRDAKRKEDTMIFLQALKDYQQNNRGQLPKITEQNGTNWGSECSVNRGGWNNSTNCSYWRDFYNKYLGEDFLNPDGEKYSFQILSFNDPWEYYREEIEAEDFATRYADLYIFLSSTCKNGEITASNNSRNLAIITKLEAGTYCADM